MKLFKSCTVVGWRTCREAWVAWAWRKLVFMLGQWWGTGRRCPGMAVGLGLAQEGLCRAGGWMLLLDVPRWAGVPPANPHFQLVAPPLVAAGCWQQLWSCIVRIYKNDWWSRKFLEGSVWQLIQGVFFVFMLQEICQWIQSKHITSCGRWTRNEISLSNNFLPSVKVTDLAWLVVLTEMGQYRQLQQQGCRKSLVQRHSVILGRVNTRWWLVAMWTIAQQSKRSDRKLILASCSSSTATPVFGWVRVEQGLVRDGFCLSLAFKVGCDVSAFYWGFSGMFSQSLPAVVQSLKGGGQRRFLWWCRSAVLQCPWLQPSLWVTQGLLSAQGS